MLRQVRAVPSPRGLRRLLYRLPLLLYHTGCGWMLGRRFVLLEHTGRKTGRSREAVLEVVDYDRAGNRVIVAAAWGERADWYRNIQSHAMITITIGRSRLPALARQLEVRDAQDVLIRYGSAHPNSFRFVAKLMGYETDGSEADMRELGAHIPLVALSVVGDGCLP